MTQNESLAILLPRAMDIGNDQIAARRFDILSFVNGQNGFITDYIHSINYNPAIANVQLWRYNAGIVVEQIPGVDGYIPFEKSITRDEPIVFSLFNLSTNTDCYFTIYYQGIVFGEK